MDILKYTTETRLYTKNNEDIVTYFDEVKEQYNYILRKVYYIIKNNPKLKEHLLINQFIMKVRKDFKYKDAKREKRYVYGKCFFNNHKKLLKEILRSKNSPLTYQIIERNNKYYLQCTFEINNCNLSLTDNTQGTIGVDFNEGFVAISQTNKYGHLVSIDKMTYRFGSGNKTKNDLLLIINKLAELALKTGKDIVVEDLNFLKTISKTIKGESKRGRKYNKMIHGLAYRTFLDRAEQICNRENVGLIKVSPAWTSWIAKNKFCDKMKLNVHTGAAFVIARRGMNIKDVV